MKQNPVALRNETIDVNHVIQINPIQQKSVEILMTETIMNPSFIPQHNAIHSTLLAQFPTAFLENATIIHNVVEFTRLTTVEQGFEA